MKLVPTSKAAYFEVTVLSEGADGCLEIGLFASNSDGGNNDAETMPMTSKTFYRYSSLGKKEGSPNLAENTSYGSPFRTGDVVGCALTQKQEIFFTLNGSSLGPAFKHGDTETDLYPCVGFSRIGWKAVINFGFKRMFMFNVLGLSQKINWSPIEKSKGIELSGENNLIAKMRANRISRQVNRDFFRQMSTNQDAGLVQATNMLKPSFSSPGYFEVKIIQEGEANLFHIALMTPSADLKVFRETTFVQHSYWLASSGEKNAHGDAWEPYTTLFGLNDVIGCGLSHDRKIFYTLNGVNLGVAFYVSEEEFEDGMIPAVRLGKGCGVQANFGKQPFLFDPTGVVPSELVPLNYDPQTSTVDPPTLPYPVDPPAPPYPVDPSAPPYPIDPAPPYPVDPSAPPYPINPAAPSYPEDSKY